MIPYKILQNDNPEEFLALNNYADYLEDVVNWTCINIFKRLVFENKQLLLDYKHSLLSDILRVDCVELFSIALKEKIFEVEFLKDYLLKNNCVLEKDCFFYILDNQVFEYDFEYDYFIIDSIENEVSEVFQRLINIYNLKNQSISHDSLGIILEFEDRYDYLSYFINNYHLKDKEIQSALHFNYRDEYTLIALVDFLFKDERYHLITNKFLSDCLDNSFYKTAILLLDLNIDVSINYNKFLNFSIENDDILNFYKITKHENFKSNHINSYNFETLFSNNNFSLNEFNYLLNLFLLGIYWDENEDGSIPTYSVDIYEILHNIILFCIQYERFHEFKKLYHLKQMNVLFKHDNHFKDRVLKESLSSFKISQYLFSELNEYSYLKSYEANIIELFDQNPDVLNLLLERKDITITEQALINSVEHYNEEFFKIFINDKKINSFDNLNFLLDKSAINRNFKISNLLLDSNMIQLNIYNFISLTINLIKSNNIDSFNKLIADDFFIDKSFNGFAYCAAQYSKPHLLSIIMADKRYTESAIVDDHPLKSIVNKSTESFGWHSSNISVIKMLIQHKDFVFKEEYISLLEHLMISDEEDLFDIFIDFIVNTYNESYIENLNSMFLKSFSKDFKYTEKLFDICKPHLNSISKQLYSQILSYTNKYQNSSKFDMFLYFIKNINISADNKYLYFKQLANKNFDFALVLFKDKEVKKMLIENDHVIYQEFNKKLLKHSANIF